MINESISKYFGILPSAIYFLSGNELKLFIIKNNMSEIQDDSIPDFDFNYYYCTNLVDTIINQQPNKSGLVGRFNIKMRMLFNTEEIGNSSMILTQGAYLLFTIQYMNVGKKIKNLNHMMKKLFSLDSNEFEYKQNRKGNEFLVWRKQ